MVLERARRFIREEGKKASEMEEAFLQIESYARDQRIKVERIGTEVRIKGTDFYIGVVTSDNQAFVVPLQKLGE